METKFLAVLPYVKEEDGRPIVLIVRHSVFDYNKNSQQVSKTIARQFSSNVNGKHALVLKGMRDCPEQIMKQALVHFKKATMNEISFYLIEFVSGKPSVSDLPDNLHRRWALGHHYYFNHFKKYY